jgi:hypothetical protein
MYHVLVEPKAKGRGSIRVKRLKAFNSLKGNRRLSPRVAANMYHEMVEPKQGGRVVGEPLVPLQKLNLIRCKMNAQMIVQDDTKKWYLNGRLHRADGPAVEYEHGAIWYSNGRLHRADGPAKTCDGVEEWYYDGRRHREDGPAIIRPDGSREWYLGDKLHRTDGPAVENADGTEEYWIRGMKNINPY